MKRILLVGGGTAGHVEPALAVADWLLTNSEDVSCEFVGKIGRASCRERV
jgi:UDP-N-acetylglucosamine:LPS N-acetylglucosamine transferase